jgi:hypothetical protein
MRLTAGSRLVSCISGEVMLEVSNLPKVAGSKTESLLGFVPATSWSLRERSNHSARRTRQLHSNCRHYGQHRIHVFINLDYSYCILIVYIGGNIAFTSLVS